MEISPEFRADCKQTCWGGSPVAGSAQGCCLKPPNRNCKLLSEGFPSALMVSCVLKSAAREKKICFSDLCIKLWIKFESFRECDVKIRSSVGLH